MHALVTQKDNFSVFTLEILKIESFMQDTTSVRCNEPWLLSSIRNCSKSLQIFFLLYWTGSFSPIILNFARHCSVWRQLFLRSLFPKNFKHVQRLSYFLELRKSIINTGSLFNPWRKMYQKDWSISTSFISCLFDFSHVITICMWSEQTHSPPQYDNAC